MPKAGKQSKLKRVARRVAVAPITAGGDLSSSTTLDKIHVPATPTSHEVTTATKTPTDDGKSLSRGQRKRQAKRDQFKRREKLILSSLVLKRQEEQKKRIDGLDAIRDALLDTTSTDVTKKTGRKSSIQEQDAAARPPSYNSNRSKRKLVAEEIEHLGLVLEHPSYQSNPFETMQEHLRNTLREEKAALESKAKDRTAEETTKRDEQKRLKKERMQGITFKRKPKKKYKAGRTR